MRIGINGLGRIGRTLARVLWQRGRHDVAQMNDLNPDVDNIVYLLRYDSNFGRFPATVSSRDRGLSIAGDGRQWKVEFSAKPDTREVGWSDAGIDVVLEATGTDTNNLGCREYTSGTVRHAIITHTRPEADATIVFGVNEETLDPLNMPVISASICDANALSPVMKVVNDCFGIEHAFVTTLHPWLSYQNLVDGPVRFRAKPGQFYPDYALGRGSTTSLIPKTTTAGPAIMSLLPDLDGHISSSSYRVPTSLVCYGDVSAHLKTDTTREAVIDALMSAAPFVRLSDEPLVSTDLIGETASAVVDIRWLSVEHGRYIKVSVGYDNEWGYCSRVVDLIDRLEEQSGKSGR